LLREDLRHEFPPAAHADFVKDRLQMVLDGVGGDVKRFGDCGGRQADHHLLKNLPFPLGESICGGYQWCDFHGLSQFNDHCDSLFLILSAQTRRMDHKPPA